MSIYSAFKAVNPKNVAELGEDVSKNLLRHIEGKGIIATADVPKLLADQKVLDSAFHRNFHGAFDAFRKMGIQEGLTELEMRRQFINGITSELPEAVSSDPQKMTSLTRSMRSLLETPPNQKVYIGSALEIRNDISDTMNKLIINVGNTNRIPIEDFFGQLAAKMRDPSQDQLVKTLAETGKAQPKSFKDIAVAIRNGDKVAEDDFWALAKFLDKNLDVSAAKKSAAQQQSPFMVPGANGRVGSLVQAGEKIFNKVEGLLPDKPKRPSRNILSEWESADRSPPSTVGRVINTIRDNKMTMGAPLVAATMFFGNVYHTNFISDLSYTGDWAKFRTGLGELGIFGDEDAIKEQKGYNQVVGLIYRRLNTAGEIDPNGRFDTLTKKITGRDLFTTEEREKSGGIFGQNIKKTLDFSSSENVETIRHLVEKAQSANGGVAGKFSDDELLAYKLYLSKIVNTTAGKNDATWNPTTDGKALVDGWAEKTAIQMNQDPKLRDSIIKKYYGQALDENNPALLKTLHEKRGGNQADAYFNVMSRYLTLTGKIDKLETAFDPQALNKYVGGIETATKGKIIAELEKAGVDVLKQIGAANAGINISQPEQTTQNKCIIKIPSKEKLAEILDNASTVTNIPIAVLKSAFDKSTQNGCVDSDLVQNELNKTNAAQASRATGWIMKGLSEGPS